MIDLKKNFKEYELFNNLSNEWWDEDGKFKVLHQIRPLRLSYILKQINSKKLKQLEILDVGCGGGLISESLARLNARVTGIDFVEKNIIAAKKHAKIKKLKIDYICADIENFSFKKKYDVIILFEVLEHLDNWKNYLKGIKSNLNKNGVIVISTINRTIVAKYAAIMIAENILKWIPKGTHEYAKLIKPNEIKRCLEDEGLISKNLQGMVYDPLTFKWRFSENTLINYFYTFFKPS